MATAEEAKEDDDEWMDWETRSESIPMGKHIIAGKYKIYGADNNQL